MYTCLEESVSTQTRDSLILEHLPQVRIIARRIHERLPGNVSIDDLISSGTLGLIAGSSANLVMLMERGAPHGWRKEARAGEAARNRLVHTSGV